MNLMKKLVVIEYANSEIGTIQDIQQVINICHFYNAIVYVDCTGSISQKQWLVTALEILCALKGKDPKGIEYPGTFGSGLKAACGVSKAVKSTFKNLCS